MLDLMEMRGFKYGWNADGTSLYLNTPDGYGYYVQEFQNHSLIKCAFAAFESLNHMYP
jgi:hypothetical protein